jgi:hypothetical protein
MLRAITGRQRILPGLDAVVLEDGSPVLLFNQSTADSETLPVIVQAFIITEAVVYQADDGQHVGRYSDDFSGAIVDMSYGGDQAARALCRQWIRRPAFSFLLAQPEPRQ